MKYEKVDYAAYNGKYDESKLALIAEHPEQMSLEDVRQLLYGQTFTDEYAQGEIPDELSMDYWKERSEQIALDSRYENDPSDFDKEAMVQRLLGKNHGIDPTDYFVDSPQELLLLLAIESTGDGKTPETAKYVIDVHQEYEYLQRVFPLMDMRLLSQKIIHKTYDCLELADGDEKTYLYFHIGRRVEVGYKFN